MPPTWDMYGVDANGDGQKDPFNPVDAIFAAARYLRAAGADKDLYRAIFAYNHADWYVESVLMRARVIGGLPSDLVGSLTGLTQGRFPVQAKATYAGAMPDSELEKRFEPGQNAARIVESDATRRSIRIFSRKKAPVVAVQDGVIRKLGKHFVVLEDPYGNTYRYSGLAEIAESYPAPRTRKAQDRELELPKAGKTPSGPASKTKQAATHREPATKNRAAKQSKTVKATPKPKTLPAAVPSKERLFAHPRRPNAKDAGGAEQLGLLKPDEPLFIDGEKINSRKFVAKPLRKGARVVAGTVLGRIGERGDELGLNVNFKIRPAGRGAPRIDPKPILDGWKLLESTAIYRSKKTNPFFGTDVEAPSIGQIMLMSKDALQRHVLRNPNIEIYECGRQDIRTGQIDRRVLATLEYLASSGLKPTVTSMRCGHGYYTAGGNVSEHSTGTAVDIGAINGIVITPSTQGKGSITDLTIQRLLTLQGTMKPHQIISLMTFQGTDNTFAMGDHGDHIHVGWRPELRRQLQGRAPDGRRAQARPVDQAHRPDLGDRQPRASASSPPGSPSRSPSARRTPTPRVRPGSRSSFERFPARPSAGRRRSLRPRGGTERRLGGEALRSAAGGRAPSGSERARRLCRREATTSSPGLTRRSARRSYRWQASTSGAGRGVRR